MMYICIYYIYVYIYVYIIINNFFPTKSRVNSEQEGQIRLCSLRSPFFPTSRKSQSSILALLVLPNGLILSLTWSMIFVK